MRGGKREVWIKRHVYKQLNATGLLDIQCQVGVEQVQSSVPQ